MTEIERYEAQSHLVHSEPEVDSWVHILAPVGDLAAKIAGTDFVPAAFKGKPAAVAGAILFGRELGLPPMTTLKNTYVVHGTPDLSAEAQRALVLAAGHEIEFEEVTATRCKMRGRRTGSEVWTQAAYTMDEAKQSGDFAKNGNYKTRPQEMLIARCTSRLCSMIFPDVTGGFSSAVNVPLVQADDEPQSQPQVTEQATVTVRQEVKKPRTRSKPKIEPKQAEPAAQPEPEAPAEPPLPGEDGYDEFTGEILDAEIEPETEPFDDEPEMITAAQSRKLFACLKALHIDDRDHGLSMIADILARPVESTKTLTKAEASMVVSTLDEMARRDG